MCLWIKIQNNINMLHASWWTSPPSRSRSFWMYDFSCKVTLTPWFRNQVTGSGFIRWLQLSWQSARWAGRTNGHWFFNKDHRAVSQPGHGDILSCGNSPLVWMAWQTIDPFIAIHLTKNSLSFSLSVYHTHTHHVRLHAFTKESIVITPRLQISISLPGTVLEQACVYDIFLENWHLWIETSGSINRWLFSMSVADLHASVKCFEWVQCKPAVMQFKTFVVVSLISYI